MWIIPLNHPLRYHYAQECVDSIEDLKEELQHYGTYQEEKVLKNGTHTVKELSNMPLMWRSSHLSPSIWLGKWNKVYWLPLLFGRTLKHSRGDHFTEKYTSSLVDFLASHFHNPGYRKELRTQDISSHSLNLESTQLDLFSFGSKTSPTISTSDTVKSEDEYRALVTKLKRTYSLRKKWALHILGSVYSSSLWPTPTALNRVRDEETLQKCLVFRKQNANQNTVPLYLQETVQKWASPMSRDHKGQTGFLNQPSLPNQVNLWTTPLVGATTRKTKFKQGGTELPVQVNQWTTPSSRDWKDTAGMEMQRPDGKNRCDQLPRQVFGLHPKEDSSTTSSTLVLNPNWVLQLMGTTIQKTFFGWREMPSYLRQPNSHSEL